MSSNKHTAGQWAIRDLEIIGPIGSNKSICEITGNFMDEYEAEANAKLIAAAPKLLEALQLLINFCGIIPKDVFTQSGQNDFQALLNNAHAAIKEATGN